MYLYELAIELDERSADLAEKAEELHIGPILAATELTTEQVQALRAAFGRGEAAAASGPTTEGIALGSNPETAPVAPDEASRRRSFLAVGALALGVVALIGFFLLKSEPDAARQKAIAADLRAWEEAPAPTVDPEVKAHAERTVAPDEPLDRDALCAAHHLMVEQEARPAMSIDELRAQSADNGVWRKAVDDMARLGPAVAKDEIAAYRDTVAKYDEVIAGATDPELRAYVDDEPRGSLVNRRADVDRVRKAMEGQIVPICGKADG